MNSMMMFAAYSAAAPLQKAVAAGLRDLQTWGQTLAAEQAQRSALVGQALRDLGLQVAQPSGSYYVVADFSPLFDRYGATTSAEMSRALTEP